MQTKSKTVMSLNSKNIKEGIFLLFILLEENFSKFFILPQYIVYWIYFQNIWTFSYRKIILHTYLLLVFKIAESLHFILKTDPYWAKAGTNFDSLFLFLQIIKYQVSAFVSKLNGWRFAVRRSCVIEVKNFWYTG